MNTDSTHGQPSRLTAGRMVYPILVCSTHLLNDMMQSVIPAVYPLLKEKYSFTFAQIGIITLVFQMTSLLLQPFAGQLADSHPGPIHWLWVCVLHWPDYLCLPLLPGLP